MRGIRRRAAAQGIAVKRRRGQAGMAKGSPSRAIGRWRRPPFQWESMGNSGKPSLRSWWTICVHQTFGQPSRRLSRPVVWSIWLSSRTIAPIAVSRGRRAGWRAGKAAIWTRMSGEALQRIQRSPSSDRGDGGLRAWLGRYAAVADSATVAAVAVPLGKPPPAADRIRMCMGLPRGWRRPGRPGPNGSAVGEVEVTSKPRRRSVKLGLVHMGSILSGGAGRFRQVELNISGARPNETFEGVFP